MFQKLERNAKIRSGIRLGATKTAASLVLALAASGMSLGRAETLIGAPAASSLAKEGFNDRNVDESALRYYASTGQTERADAELRRLHNLYPKWTAPDNIYEKAGAGGSDEEDLWDLFAADKLDLLRAAIEERRAAEPGWEPSSDLRAKYRAKAFRNQITAMAKDERYGDIVQMLKSTGLRLDGVDIDILWTIADAYQKSHQNAQALAVYRAILTNNSDPAQRLATVQKSMGFMRMDDVEQLLALARKDASGRSEFAAIAIDIARARISAFLHDERANEVDADDLKQFGVYARAAKDPNQPALLAWYYFKLRRYSSALDWFKFALERGGDAMVAHGLAHSLRFLGMKREAEEVAYAWREPLVNNSILFIDILETELTKPSPPYIEPARLARYGEVAMSVGSGQGAQALAWYAYNSCQYEVARQWFERAVAWFPKEPTVYGYALTLRRLKKRKEAVELINRYDGLFPKVVELLFPDGQIHPPGPCDQPAGAARPVTVQYNGQPNNGRPYNGQQYNGTGPQAWAGQAAPNNYVQDPGRQYSWGRVAGPGQTAPGAAVADSMPKIDRAEFPIRVEAENPLRFAPTAQPPVLNAPVGDAAPAMAGGFAREPMPSAFPLVARRVPGVGPMPYERYGFALLPGYNGVTRASAPTASEQIAPAGTLWSLERRNDVSLDLSNAPLVAPRVETKAPASPMLDIDAPAKVDPMRNG